MHPRETIRRYLQACPLLPAPMCGYTDRPFRDLLRPLGGCLVYTEMYSSEALVRGDPKAWRLMDYFGEEPPVAVQIFGSRPNLLAESARIVARYGAAVVDLNMGCPAKKITVGGCGAALAQNFPNAKAAVRAIRKAIPDMPFTVKIRWQPGGRALEIARMCEGEGVNAIAMHARTREQAYTGQAHWPWIAELKQAVTSIPVIGNGDIKSVDDVERMFAETGCDAVMIGRAFFGNPWLMRDFLEHRATGRPINPPTPEERLAMLRAHAHLMWARSHEHGLIEFRKHCVAYLHGLPGARSARAELMQVVTLDALEEVLGRHFPPGFEFLEQEPIAEYDHFKQIPSDGPV